MINRRHLLATTAAAALPLPALGQSKPEKLVYVGDNGPWHFAMLEEVAPAFEKATGIKIDFTLLPTDPWGARLKAELGAGSSDIDVGQWSGGTGGRDHGAQSRLGLGRFPGRQQARRDL